MISVTNPTDFQGLAGIRAAALEHNPEAAREVAVQFEALVIGELLKSARESSLSDGLLDGPGSDHYHSMFDQQVALDIARNGGFGFADQIEQHLSDQPPPQLAWRPQNREDFVQAIWGHAVTAGEALGVAPEAIVAHAALETGWGQSMPEFSSGQPTFNLFGIKAGESWHGARVGRATLEFEAGIPQRRTEPFRAYGSLADGFQDYVKLLQKPHYGGVIGSGNDIGEFAANLKAGGYATDPDYINKLVKLADSPEFHRLIGELKSSPTTPTQARN